MPFRSRRPWMPAAIVGVAAVLAAAVPVGAQAITPVTVARPTGGSAPEAGAQPGSVPAVAWKACPGAKGKTASFQCATYAVPLDYADPDGATVTLALTRIPAKDKARRVGSLFVNPGGPGGSGVGLAQTVALAPQFARLAQRFDVIGFDPRGTGASTPSIRCWTDTQLFRALGGTKATDRSAAGLTRALALGAQFNAACQKRSAAILPYVGTEFVARDMDRLRAAVGEEKLDYLGFSYGTFLGAVYADLFPGRVRRAVLDGALDPEEYANHYLDLLRKNYRASENALGQYLAWCAANRKACGFGGSDPAKALDSLIADLDRRPVTVTVKGTRIVTTGYGIATTLYVVVGSGRAVWPQLGPLLTLAQQRKGPLLDNSILGLDETVATNVVVECTDTAGTADRGDFLRNAARSRALAPRIGGPLVVAPPTYDGSNGAACAQWPVRPVSRWNGDFRAQGSAPILVVGTTNDPSTPYSGAISLTSTLDNARLLTDEGEGHTAYNRSACIRGRVDAYLISGTLPPVGTRCTDRPAPARSVG